MPPRSGNASLEHAPCRIHRLLPNELLSYIFAFYANSQHPINNLTTVCRLWYQILHRTPQVWSSLAIAFGLNWAPGIHRLPIWIDRAGRVPLKLKLYLGTTAEWSEPDVATKVAQNCQNIIGLVGPRIVTRVNIAYFTCATPSHVLVTLQNLFGVNGMRVDRLETLDLRAWRGSWQPLDWALPDRQALEAIFADATSLSVMTCPLRIFLAAHPSYSTLEYLHVTEIDHRDSLHKALVALRGCPALYTLKYESQISIRDGDEADPIPKDFEPVDFPHLYHLEVIGAVDLAAFSRFVSFPSLQTIALRSLQLTHSGFEAGFRCLAEKKLRITKLLLRDFHSPANLGRLFRSLKDLMELEVREIRELQREDLLLLSPSVSVHMDNCTGTAVGPQFGTKRFSLATENYLARRKKEYEKRRHSKWSGSLESLPSL